jgi:hypothetical protein
VISYKVQEKDCTVLPVVVFYSSGISDAHSNALKLYKQIVQLLVQFKANYCLSDKPFAMITTGHSERNPHLKAVVDFVRGNQDNKNLFILDFCHHLNNAKTDPAYHPVKQVLMEGSYVSQFVNCNH